MYDIPEETVDDLDDTLKLIRYIQKKGIHRVNLSKFTMLAGTEVTQENKDNLVFTAKNTIISGFIYDGMDKQLILQHKDIFPHFFRVENNNLHGFERLEDFLTIFCGYFFYLFKFTYELIMEYFDDSLLNYYYKICGIDEELQNDIYSEVEKIFYHPEHTLNDSISVLLIKYKKNDRKRRF